MARPPALHLVRHPAAPARRSPEPGADGDVGDLALTAAIFAVALLPLAGAAAHVGRWGPGELGVGTAGSLLAGRELWARVGGALRASRLTIARAGALIRRRRSRETPSRDVTERPP